MRRRNLIFLLALGMLLIFPAASRAQTVLTAEQIAKTYGLDSFGQVAAIRYTWNHVDASGRKISRTWEWSPKPVPSSKEGNRSGIQQRSILVAAPVTHCLGWRDRDR